MEIENAAERFLASARNENPVISNGVRESFFIVFDG